MELEQKAIKANLDGTTYLEVNEDALYFIDFSKLQRIEDLILILAAIGFTFSPRHPHFDLLKPFMNLGQPIMPNDRGAGNIPEIKLPTLNPLNKKDGE
jgi:hypothetical protein